MRSDESGQARLFIAVLACVISGCGGSSGTTPLAPLQTAAAPTSVSPASGGTGVALNQGLSASFPTAMDATTINDSTFTVTGPAGALVAGAVTYDATNRIARFSPASNYAANSSFTARLSTGVKDAAGRPLASAQVWTFATGTAVGNGALAVSSTNPADGAANVSTNQLVTANFRSPMNGSTITASTFTVSNGSGAVVAGSVVYDSSNRSAVFSPTSGLPPSTTFIGRLSTDVRDAAGNPFAAPFVWGFTTGTAADTTPPLVIGRLPANGATGVALSQKINATFDEAMDSRTITATAFTVTGPGASAVAGTVTYDGASRIGTFSPAADLSPSSVYTPTVAMTARDLAGNALAQVAVWNFTTGVTGTASGEASVNLASTSNFAVLAGSTVTNTGPSIINGNIGLSPGSAVIGFPPGTINGSLHVSDPTAAQAKLDLTAAYNDAQGRSTAPITVSGNLGGQTLVPGLYKTGSSLEISSGDLTLDGKGDVNGVFIFQMGSTLTTTAGRQVILSGGAKASNVYWQVSTSATLGTNSVFKGNILADQSITLNSGATLDGRALTRIGAVSLAANIVTIPAP